MTDDEIPILTNVVKREQRSDPTLTPAVRDKLLKEAQRCAGQAANDIIDDVLTDIHHAIKAQLHAQLSEQLPAIVARIIDAHIADHRVASDPDRHG